MKIRVMPLVLTILLSAALLFGGWTAFRHFSVEKPLDRVAASVPGVLSATTKMSTGQVVVNVHLSPDADLAEVYRKLKQDGSGQIGGKKLELKVDSNASPLLEKAWSYSLFDVAEAMETHRYTGIRDALDKLSGQFKGVTASTDIDADNVYIRLQEGKSAKFVVLPRQAGTMGVWPNA
ncbi:hypothetical protein E5161_02675 [Cohnella pontilimi]|uniref:Uncharacterized protein n=1 Tax=Cohnella pontilimi TaxID=2564100 RepID=A0A4U0FHA3_9BACL|nr:hypothetical protein [Cohnella pontilimi]TJY44308.1 hypothetical protein E5161_02675 [Cohnella pontilimi]